MKLDTIKEACAVLYGPRWKHELAREMGVTPRTIMRWASGAMSPPLEIATFLLRVERRKQAELYRIRRKLAFAVRWQNEKLGQKNGELKKSVSDLRRRDRASTDNRPTQSGAS